MPVPIQITGAAVDLSQRFDRSIVVVASPALAAETIICTITVNTDETLTEGVDLDGWAAYTVGTTAVTAQLRIRRTNVAGTVVADSGLVTRVAAQLVEHGVQGFDAAPALTGQVYVLTLQVPAATAVSTVSATKLTAVSI
jgi:predicted permease